jgi:hypothetical protein
MCAHLVFCNRLVVSSSSQGLHLSIFMKVCHVEGASVCCIVLFWALPNVTRSLGKYRGWVPLPKGSSRTGLNVQPCELPPVF